MKGFNITKSVMFCPQALQYKHICTDLTRLQFSPDCLIHIHFLFRGAQTVQTFIFDC